MKKSTQESYIFQTSVGSDEEFSLELFEFSPDLQCNGNPCKRITGFDELLGMIDELEENLPDKSF